MNKVKYFCTIFCMLTLFASCSNKQQGKQGFNFKVGAFTSSLGAVNGGIFIRAISSSSNTIIKLDDTNTVDLAFGTWEFQAVMFEGPTPLSGKKFCGRIPSVAITANNQDLNMTINEANCANEPLVSLIQLIDTQAYAQNGIVIAAINPAAGAVAGATLLTIYGTGFKTGASVNLRGVPCTAIVVISFTQMTCLTPPLAAGPASITITNSDNQTKTQADAYNYQLAPTVTSINKMGGPLSGGTNVVITGTGFFAGAIVKFDTNICLSINVISSTTISCTTPAHAVGLVSLTVTNNDTQIGSLGSAFHFSPPPAITSTSLSSGAAAAGALTGGTTLKIYGTGFVMSPAPAPVVTVGGAACTSVNVFSATIVICTTPAHAAGAVAVAMTSPDDQIATLSSGFTYQAAPTVSNVSLNSGSNLGGTNVTITGTGFLPNAIVKFGTDDCTAVTVSSTRTFLTCATPAHAVGSVSVTVTNFDDQVGILSAGYTYNLAPIITALSFNTSALEGGTAIAITGSNFATGATVNLGGSACAITQATSTLINCTTTSHATGAVDVIVTNPDTQSYAFTNGFKYLQSFVSTWRTTTAGESITLPLVTGYNYNFQIDWGDGSAVSSVTAYNSANAVHAYASAGDHVVKMNGLIQAWNFVSFLTSLQIISVGNFGDMGWVNLSSAFYSCDNLTSFSGGITTGVTDMSYMFSDASALTSLNLSSFNTSAVTDMSYMFANAFALTSMNLSNFNTSAVTNMSGMFYGATYLTSLNLSSFNTSAVTDMSIMFKNTYALTSLDLSSFITSSVTNMTEMFLSATALTSLNVSSFRTTAVTDMTGMFWNTHSLTSLDLSSFNTSAVTNMSYMFNADSALTSLDLSNFNTSAVTNMSSMFAYNTSLATLNTTNWDLNLSGGSTNVFLGKNVGLTVTCNQGGTPGTGTFFGETCH